MNKYIIPVCLVREDVNWPVVIMARSISDCQDKLITVISEKCGIEEEFDNYREFKHAVDSEYDIIIGDIKDYETL